MIKTATLVFFLMMACPLGNYSLMPTVINHLKIFRKLSPSLSDIRHGLALCPLCDYCCGVLLV